MTNLSYSLKKKKSKLIEQKGQMKFYISILVTPLIISFLLGTYIIFSIEKFFYYIFPYFAVSSPISAQVKSLDVIILYAFIASASATAIIYLCFNSIKSKHDDLRKDVIKSIGASLCNCKNSCTCKDDFIKEMEKEKIDLIFEK